jgi:O-antigen/teichoic acid export membrane protein
MVRDVGWLWIGQGVTKLLAFVAFAFLARRLDSDSYGVVEYVLGLAAFAALVIDGGLGMVGIRRVAQDAAAIRSLPALIGGAQALLVAAVVPAMCAFAFAFAPDARAGGLALIVGCGLLVTPWRQEWVFQATGRIIALVGSQILRSALFALGIVVLVRVGTTPYMVGFAEATAVLGCTLFLAALQARATGKPRLAMDRRALGGLFQEAWPVGAAGVVWACIHLAPLFVVGSLVGMAEAGLFGAALRLTVTLVSLSFAYHVSFYPAVARQLAADAHAAFAFARASVRIAAWVGVGVALALTLAAAPLLALLFGARFAAAASSLQILAWIFPVTLLSGHARWMLVAAGRGRAMLTAQIAGLALALGATPLLVVGFGAQGAAAATLLASLGIWATAQTLAVRRIGAVPIAPVALPVLVAGALIAGAVAVAPGRWATVAVTLAVYALLAPLVDRRLVADLRRLLRSRQRAAPPEVVGGEP